MPRVRERGRPSPRDCGFATEPGSVDVAVDWDDVDGADGHLVRWRRHGPDQDLNDGVRRTSSDTTITVTITGNIVWQTRATTDDCKVEPLP